MGKVTHSLKLDIIELDKCGLKVSGIVKSLSSRGHTISRQQVSYWLNQYKLGYFDPLCIEEKVVKFKKVCLRDIELVTKSLSLDPLQSSVDVHKDLKKDGYSLSLGTTKRVISAAGFTSSAPRYAQMVRDVNKVKRVDFCRQLISDNDTLDNIIFSDESSVQLHHNRTVGYRLKTESRGTVPKPKHPLKVHVWGGISRRGKTNLVIFEGIMEKTFFTSEILQGAALPFITQTYPDGHRFQQDNDPKHRSKLAREFMSDHGINHWDIWPSESPDINPIEMVWAQMKRAVAKAEPSTKEELIQAIMTFWNEQLTLKLCNRYIDHVFKVAPVCVLMNGKATADIPNKLFSVSSEGKSFVYFDDLLKSEPLREKVNSVKCD